MALSERQTPTKDQVSPSRPNSGGKTKSRKAALDGERPSERESGSLYKVETEKLLLSSDKVTIGDLWKSTPQPCFPTSFLERLDLSQELSDAQHKSENLKQKMDNRRLEEKRKEEAKQAEV